MVYTLSGVGFPAIPSSSSVKRAVRSSFDADRKINHLSSFLRNRSTSRKNLARSSACDSESQSSAVAATEKILVPGSESDGFSSSIEQLEVVHMVLEDPEVSSDIDGSKMGNESEIEVEENYTDSADGCGEDNGKQDSASSLPLHQDGKVKGVAESDVEETISSESEKVRKSTIPPPGFGQKIYEIDPLLRNFSGHLDYRYGQYKKMRAAIDKYEGGLEAFSRGYEKFGFTRSATGITYREWAPGARYWISIRKHSGKPVCWHEARACASG